MAGHSLRVLEYQRVRELLAMRTRTEPGRLAALALEPLSGREEIFATLAEVDEARRLLGEQGEAPLGGVADLREVLRRVEVEDAWLDIEALAEVHRAICCAGECRAYFQRSSHAPLLTARAEQLQPLVGLREALGESIGPRGEVLDGASFELAELRGRIRTLRGRIRQRLEALLADEQLAPAFQDRLITERGDRYVLPVRADRRGLLRGFVHDESGSGQTLYVEPAATLEANNELCHLLHEEQREVRRILLRLSAAVRRAIPELLANQQVLGCLDLRCAAGRLSRDYGGCAPRLTAEPEFDLRQARHPLLLFDGDGAVNNRVAVPIDLRLGAEARVLVISGPNTGGKTVALKTLGLLQLMLASGLHIPCHPDSRTCLFGKVLADIGDEQDIAANLSTFSGHLRQVREVLRQADENSLVLLDEVGTGTDPVEGGALAMALLEELRVRRSKTVVTTHLNLVKGYAQLTEEVVNAAVEFDPETLEPTYRLHYGVPGASGAFTIARRMGLPDELLQRAESYLAPGDRSGQQLLEELNRLRQQAAEDAAEAERLKRLAGQERERRCALLHEFEQQRRDLLDKARRQARKLVRDAETRLRQLFEEAKGGGLSTPRQAELARAVRDVAAESPRSAPVAGARLCRALEPGELVRLRRLGSEGEVVRVDGEQVDLLLAGKRLRCCLADLEFESRPRYPGKRAARIRGVRVREGFQPKLLLVGSRVDEALPRLERFLDDALLNRQRQVEVVHGSGEGVLRRAVRELLAGHRAVTAFHAADLSRGGDNVTVVELEN
ncbi:endonuclease MutS2 [Geothermobacter hydrogeniphilus]|uniref:Endonuclease MutS2 n=1 Tax=Geothermobacter hydrogeniphilus TaxID=1969733 RepID=A0A2K2HA57_9BACT|nr:endonuclease MutS2 [Geothermobacter hydrogeniphilus]PNU20151.1 endonuclease MutS2 [Geothermobacter hydrogeniphilus]